MGLMARIADLREHIEEKVGPRLATFLPPLWLVVSLIAVALYVAIVVLVGFRGVIAYSIQFGRVALAVAVLTIFLPSAGNLFKEVPAPRRDYLLAGIILTWLSAVSFAIWNQAGLSFGFERSVFLSAIAGGFSLLLVLGGLFHFLAPGPGVPRKTLAIVLGLLVAAMVVLLPLFF